MSKMKKFLAVAAGSLASACLFATAASASSAIPGTVKVSTYLNVRSAGNTGAPVVDKIYNGANVTIVDSSNGWDKIIYNGGTGWVAGQYITSSSTQVSGTPGTVVVSGSLNVRSAGNTGAPIIGTLKNGAQVTIFETSNGWNKISYNGGTGWVSSQYISTTNRAQTVVAAAKSQLGVRYIFGGASSSGFDCSGLTMYAYGKVGISLPHSAAQQAGLGWAVSRSALQPGDMVFFATGSDRTITHVGIYTGNGMFISAQSGAGSVKEASLSNSYWSSAYVTARRLM